MDHPHQNNILKVAPTSMKTQLIQYEDHSDKGKNQCSFCEQRELNNETKPAMRWVV
jgi:hypothetical protein